LLLVIASLCIDNPAAFFVYSVSRSMPYAPAITYVVKLTYLNYQLDTSHDGPPV